MTLRIEVTLQILSQAGSEDKNATDYFRIGKASLDLQLLPVRQEAALEISLSAPEGRTLT